MFPDDAKLDLIAASGTRITVDPVLLAGTSPVFRNMLAMPSPSSTAEVKLEEDSEVLQMIVDILERPPYRLPHFKLAEEVAKAVNKYEMDLVRAAILLKCRHIVSECEVDDINVLADYPSQWMSGICFTAQLEEPAIVVDCLILLAKQGLDLPWDVLDNMGNRAAAAFKRSSGLTRTNADLFNLFERIYYKPELLHNSTSPSQPSGNSSDSTVPLGKIRWR